MKNLPKHLEEEFTLRLTALLMYTPALHVEADIKTLRKLIGDVLQVVDDTVEKVCRPHDYVRMAAHPGKMCCARCGDEVGKEELKMPTVDTFGLLPDAESSDDHNLERVDDLVLGAGMSGAWVFHRQGAKSHNQGNQCSAPSNKPPKTHEYVEGNQCSCYACNHRSEYTNRENT